MKSIARYSFDSCTSLVSFFVPKNVSSIDSSYSFLGSTYSLLSIEVDEENPYFHSAGNCLIASSSNTVIAGCWDSVIPDYVTAISSYAFFNQIYLETINIPDSVTSIGGRAFRGCKNLKSVEMTKNSQLKTIGYTAFLSCQLTEFFLPKTITAIDGFAFGNCTLEVLWLSSSCTKLTITYGYLPFFGCGLKTIYVEIASEEDIPSGWCAGWNSGADIVYGVSYDEENDLWYVADGLWPQSLCEDVPDEFVDDFYETFSLSIGKDLSAVVEVYSDGENQFAYVTIGDNSAWFNVEKIRYELCSGYENLCICDFVVSQQIVTFGCVTSQTISGFDFSQSEFLSSYLFTDVEFGNDNGGEMMYQGFYTKVYQSIVNEAAKEVYCDVSIASVQELDYYDSYQATCTDFVAFLASGGTNTTGGYFMDFWTRNLAFELDSDSNYGACSYGGFANNGVYVTSSGLISNAWLSAYMGARLSLQF